MTHCSNRERNEWAMGNVRRVRRKSSPRSVSTTRGCMGNKKGRERRSGHFDLLHSNGFCAIVTKLAMRHLNRYEKHAQVPREVDIESIFDGKVVTEKLQRNDVEQALKTVHRLGDADSLGRRWN